MKKVKENGARTKKYKYSTRLMTSSEYSSIKKQ